jgi:GNAT superfamily N-acetyltransferase
MKLLPAPRDYVIRAIAPGDRDALERFYAGLSPESRHARFHGAGPLATATCRYFCGPDHARREGFVAETVGMDGRHEVIGHLCLEPAEPGVVELAVAVADAWQRRGVGRALVAAAIAWAEAHEVTCLKASMLSGNTAVLNLVRSSGRHVSLSAADGGVVEARIAVRDVLPHAA